MRYELSIIRVNEGFESPITRRERENPINVFLTCNFGFTLSTQIPRASPGALHNDLSVNEM